MMTCQDQWQPLPAGRLPSDLVDPQFEGLADRPHKLQTTSLVAPRSPSCPSTHTDPVPPVLCNIHLSRLRIPSLSLELRALTPVYVTAPVVVHQKTRTLSPLCTHHAPQCPPPWIKLILPSLYWGVCLVQLLPPTHLPTSRCRQPRSSQVR